MQGDGPGEGVQCLRLVWFRLHDPSPLPLSPRTRGEGL